MGMWLPQIKEFGKYSIVACLGSARGHAGFCPSTVFGETQPGGDEEGQA